MIVRKRGGSGTVIPGMDPESFFAVDAPRAIVGLGLGSDGGLYSIGFNKFRGQDASKAGAGFRC